MAAEQTYFEGMTRMRRAIFLADLTQDAAICRPVAAFARSLGFPVTLLVTGQFRKRDASGVWFAELQELAVDLEADLFTVETVADTVKILLGQEGMLLSAAESSLNPHQFSHSVFLAAPPGLTRVTLQHGLECIGFNHNAAHDRMWSSFVGMACDIAASWFEPRGLHSVRSDQRAKIMAVGPPFALGSSPASLRFSAPRRRTGPMHGLVCENLHSVRFGAGSKLSFIDTLQSFADAVSREQGTLELRPHPAGRYLDKVAQARPRNVTVNRMPLYKQSLEKFDFCISSPSSVLLDMVWAGVPTAVWTGDDPSLDIDAYRGLHVVSSERDWLDFANAAASQPMPFLERQTRYLSSLPIPQDIEGAYRNLLTVAVG